MTRVTIASPVFPAALPAPRCWARALGALVALQLPLLTAPAAAQPQVKVVSTSDSFRIGNVGVLCTAQLRSEDSNYQTMFDRAYDVVCRDAASPVAKLYVLRGATRSEDTVLSQLAGDTADCDPATVLALPALPGLHGRKCRDAGSGLSRMIYVLRANGKTYAADGLGAYDSALLLGMRSLLADRQVPGEISVAIIGADDPAALARVQAERLDPGQARAAAYVHANEGSYEDASEFFDRLVARAQLGEAGATRPAEYLANLGMEQSIMGNAAEADALFARAERASSGGDPAFPALYRNLRAMHRLNQQDPEGALAILDAPLARTVDIDFTPARVTEGYIDKPLSQRLEIDHAARNRFWSGSLPLSDAERSALLDAQAMYLRGEAERLTGHAAATRADLAKAMGMFNAVRGGQVMSMAWLPADVATSLASLAEAEKKPDAAEGLLRQAVALVAAQYPDSAALLAARARLAAALARHGKTDLALPQYRELVRTAPSIVGGSDALRPLIGSYFAALVAKSDQPGAPADFFVATQALVRPGVARTQAVLARELSAGSDAAAEQFRQSVALSRELVTLDRDIARLSDPDQRKPGDTAALAAALARRQDVALQQTNVLARMDAFPRYRAVANEAVSLAELQKALRPDEAYYKLVLAGDATFAIWARAGDARIFRIDAKPADIETIVNAIRDSIALEQGNQLVTNPFDLVSARHLYQLLFDPIADELAQTKHLIFEPDGALLKLPVNVLVSADSGVAAYTARQAAPNADAFDFTGVAWLGRDHIVTTAVSARSFLDIRAVPGSRAPRRFLGLGQNAPLSPAKMEALSVNRDPCDWPLATWNHPVNGAELTLAAHLIGGNGNEVETGKAFTDTSIKARTDLADFRIVQFATHGLVTAPHPGCPARPALVTSFGSGDTSGLLTFKDIFDLHLDADTVILSACDTAGAASAAATREAGVTTGGNFALDGLVRAFVGAGARSVVASHWPVPDDYNATNRLMSGIFQAGINHSLGNAMQAAQIQLMDDPLTSHPYYWAAFAIVGDATKPLTTE